jgi:hypothetical protein
VADIQHWPHWGKTAFGSFIELYASPEFHWSQNTNPILFFGGVHGDEPEGVALAQATLSWLTQYHQEDGNTPLCPWLLIPCLNPDGYKAKKRVNGRGVDLNRNYPASNWSPQSEQNRYWPGPNGGSEPETQIIVQIIQQERPRLIIHCHSWEPCIVVTGPPGNHDARRLAEASGYTLQEHIGYPTPGSLSHYGWHDHQIPVICIEEQELLTDLTQSWPRFKKGIQAIFRDTSLRIP